jgi:hypothetical protein
MLLFNAHLSNAATSPATHTKLANVARFSDCLTFKLPAKTREILGLRVKLAKQGDETTRQNNVTLFD